MTSYDVVGARAALKKLWPACEAGDVARIRELFQTTPLTSEEAQLVLDDLLIDNVRVDVARCLLEQGASANRVSVLILRHCRSLELFQLLAEYNFDFKEKGYEILEDLVDNREILDFVLDQGAEINRPDPFRSTEGQELPPMAGRKGPRRDDEGFFDKTLGVLNNAAALGDIALFDHLVSRGGDVFKSIALHHAARCRDPVKTKAMIAHLVDKYNFDVNADDNATGLRPEVGFDPVDVGVPISFALLYENLAAVEALLEHGANVDPRRYDLIGRAIYKLPAAVKPLLAAGADATKALGDAVWKEDFGLTKLCLEHGGNPDTVLESDQNRNPGMSREMRELIEGWKKGARVISGTGQEQWFHARGSQTR